MSEKRKTFITGIKIVDATDGAVLFNQKSHNISEQEKRMHSLRTFTTANTGEVLRIIWTEEYFDTPEKEKLREENIRLEREIERLGVKAEVTGIKLHESLSKLNELRSSWWKRLKFLFNNNN